MICRNVSCAKGQGGSTDGRQDFHRFGSVLLASLGVCVCLRSRHRPMGFPFFKLIVCLLLAGPLASPGWGHARVESAARGRAQLLQEWQGVREENPATGSFALNARYTYGQDLAEQDWESSPAAADTADYYGYDGLGSVRVLIQG